ncbi:MAG: T9SS C-terminal target domain-containing protein [Candidatus Zixiibacteriota bacterium]|nr:MAG: T9SS C-terminal target domain-containing protein [candidate division Zixibacteria bacterium]
MRIVFAFLLAGIVLMAGAAMILAAEGDVLWTRTFGGPMDDDACALLPTPGGGFQLGGFTNSFGQFGDMWLVLTDAQGDSLWSHTYGGAEGERINALVACSDGGCLLVGETESYGAGDRDIWLVRTNGQGQALWTRTYGGVDFDQVAAGLATGDNGFLVAGTRGIVVNQEYDENLWLLKLNADGDTLWSRTYGGSYADWSSALIETPDAGYLLIGGTYSFGAGWNDAWILKLNSQGDSLWSRTYGGWNGDQIYGAVPTADGGFLLAGETDSFGAGDRDVWLVKINAQGDTIWTRTFGESMYDAARAVIATGNEHYLVGGFTQTAAAGSMQMWLIKIDAQGDSLWSRTVGGIGIDMAFALQQAPNGDYLLAGLTTSWGAGEGDMMLACIQGLPLAVDPGREPGTLQAYRLSVSPNPFNPTTALSFELRAASYVSLKVYDTAGREVRTLVEGWQEAGTREAILDATELPSGIYFARLQAGEFTQTQKLVLLK